MVPDTLSRIFSEVDGKPLPSEPQLAAICRNVPDDQPFHRPNPREYELSASNLDETEPVDRELFASTVSVFPVVDAAKLLDHHKQEFCQYFDYLANPDKAGNRIFDRQKYHHIVIQICRLTPFIVQDFGGFKNGPFLPLVFVTSF